MRFNFFSSFSLAALFAAQVAQAKYDEDTYQYDPMTLAQEKWDLGEDDTDLAQIWNSNLVEDHDYFAQTHNKGEAESDSDSDDDSFSNLELAQQLQELNYLNALGTINAAQVQAM